MDGWMDGAEWLDGGGEEGGNCRRGGGVPKAGGECIDDVEEGVVGGCIVTPYALPAFK